MRPPDEGRVGRGATRERGKAGADPARAAPGGRVLGREGGGAGLVGGPSADTCSSAGSDAPEAAGSGRVTARPAGRTPGPGGSTHETEAAAPRPEATLSALSVSPQPVPRVTRGRDRPGREAAGLSHVLTRGS